MQRTLVQQAQHGDRRAFEALILGRFERLYGTAALILHDRPLAEDAVQEALLRTWRGLPRLSDPDRFEGWLYRVLTHACFDTARRGRDGHDQHEIPPEALVEDLLETDVVVRDTVGRALARMTPAQRAVLVLRYYRGLTVPEVAQALHVPVGTAKSRLHHALAAMRAIVEADGRVMARGEVA